MTDALIPATDPLNEILLPAVGLANRLKHGELHPNGARDTLLASAVLVLAAERESMRWLLREERERVERKEQFIKILLEECGAAAEDRARGRMRLHSRAVA